MEIKRTKRILAGLLTMAMLLVMPPLTNISVFAAETEYQEISVTGFNHDVIANGATTADTGNNGKLSTISTTFDNPNDVNARYVFYSKDYTGPWSGYGSTAASYGGLPTDRKVSKEDITYTLQPYEQNNVLLLTNSTTSGALTLNTSGAYEKIIILASSASGGSSFNAILNFTDGSSTSTTFSIPDWWTNNTNIVVSNVCRIKGMNGNSTSGTVLAGYNDCSSASGPPYMYNCEATVPASYQGKLLKSITFTRTSGGLDTRTGIFAVSGKRATGTPNAPVATAATVVSGNFFTANWNASAGATKYFIDVATDANFTNMVSGYNNLELGNVTNTGITGLNANTTYFYRVRAGNAAGQSFSSNTINVTTASALTPSIAVGTQSRALSYGDTGTVTYTVTPSNFSTAPTFTSSDVLWFSDAAGTQPTSKKSNIDVSFSGNTLTVTMYSAVAAGEYYFKVKSGNVYSPVAVLDIGKANYTGAKTTSANVRANEVTANATLTLPALPAGAIYATSGTTGGTAALISAHNVSDTTLTYSTTSQAAGTSATITVNVTGATNYLDYSAVVTLTAVAKTNVTISGVTVANKPYDGNAISYSGTPTANDGSSNVSIASYTYTYTSTDGGGYNSTTAPKDAGAYKLTIAVANSNADYTGSTDVTFTIAKKALTVTGLAATSRAYDGTTAVAITGGSLYGNVGSDDVSAAMPTSGTVASKDVGTAKTVTFASITLSGSNKDNYTLTQPSLTVNITTKALTVTGTAVNNKTYDKTNTATFNGTPALDGVVTGDTVTIGGGTPTFASVDIDDDITVNFTNFTISGMDAGNYTVTQPGSVTANINKKTVTVSGIKAENKGYDGTTNATLVYTDVVFGGIIAGDTLTATATGTFDSAAAGTGKTVTISGITLGGASLGNYELAGAGNQTSVLAQITEGTPVVSVNPTIPAVWKGSVLPAITGGITSVPGTFAWEMPGATVNATGDYDIVFTPTDSTNYVTVTITVSVTSVDKSALEAKISEAESAKNGAAAGAANGQYPQNAIDALAAAIAAAKAVTEGNPTTQTALDSDVSALNTAITTFEAAKIIVDYSKLISTITNADKLAKGNYTDKTWNAFQTTLTNAKAMKENANATQAEVDAAEKALSDAMAALKEKASTPTGPSNPTSPGNPKTGDNSNVTLWLWIGSMTLSVLIGTIIVTERKKKKCYTGKK